MSLSFTFFATPSDLVPRLASFERSRRVFYIQMKDYPSAKPVILDSLSEFPSLGVSQTGDCSDNPPFLIRPHRRWRRAPMRKVRHRSKRNGPLLVRYELNHAAMSDSVELNLGGQYKDDCVIPGSFGCVNEGDAGQLFEQCRACLLEGFTRIQGVHLGPDALRLWRSGGKLAYVATGESIISSQPLQIWKI